jgi:hypothetical protein
MIVRKAFVALISASALSAPAFAQQTHPQLARLLRRLPFPWNQLPSLGGLFTLRYSI